MIFDQHQVALTPLRIHTAARVRGNKHVRAERLHDADRERHLLQRPPFINVESAFHRDDRFAAERSANQLAAVSRAAVERGKCGIASYGMTDSAGDVFGELAESGAENDSGRGGVTTRANRVGLAA